MHRQNTNTKWQWLSYFIFIFWKLFDFNMQTFSQCVFNFHSFSNDFNMQAFSECVFNFHSFSNRQWSMDHNSMPTASLALHLFYSAALALYLFAASNFNPCIYVYPCFGVAKHRNSGAKHFCNTYRHTYLPTYWPTYLLTCLLTYLLTCWFIDLPIYPLDYLPIYLHTYPLTYLANDIYIDIDIVMSIDICIDINMVMAMGTGISIGFDICIGMTIDIDISIDMKIKNVIAKKATHFIVCIVKTQTQSENEI